MAERKYFPTFGELVDRLSIVMLKRIFIPQYWRTYTGEINQIKHDIDLILNQKSKRIRLGAKDVTAILALALVNREIWLNESIARAGGSGQNDRLRYTHSINGQRAKAKNILSGMMGERVDMKVDALAADLPKEFGNWDVFSD